MAQNQSGSSRKLSKARIQNDPSFERTRENVQEFSEAGKACKQVRNAFRSLINTTNSGKVLGGRMQKEMYKVLKSDGVSDRGSRLVSKGDLSILKGFEFNEKAMLDGTFFPEYSIVTDRVTGKFTVSFEPFIPTKKVAASVTATHFRVGSAAAELDLEKGHYTVRETDSEYIPLTNVEITVPALEIQFTANTKLALLMVLCVEFYQEVNGKMYLLKEDKRNPLKIVHAESAIA